MGCELILWDLYTHCTGQHTLQKRLAASPEGALVAECAPVSDVFFFFLPGNTLTSERKHRGIAECYLKVICLGNFRGKHYVLPEVTAISH